MKDSKTETFIYEDLGFPIMLKCRMKKRLGEWTLDVDLAELQKMAVRQLILKPGPLTGKESRFIRKYFGMTTSEFGTLLGVSHAAVVKWEQEKTHPPYTTDGWIRMYALEQLEANDEAIGRLFHTIRKLRDEDEEGPIKVRAC